MDTNKMLTGEALVAKGINKNDATLPEIGMKEVVPNGSWLEQKQTQSALEARKYLIEVERIEKYGSLSHAEWRDDLHLAEVTQKSGGHWQYIGHNIGRQTYLYPEEALFLIELNGLQLTHNGVTVSLQKAYNLLLDKTALSIFKYRVYASLCRLGYKVLRHQEIHIQNEGPVESMNKNTDGVTAMNIDMEPESAKCLSENIDSAKENDETSTDLNVSYKSEDKEKLETEVNSEQKLVLEQGDTTMKEISIDVLDPLKLNENGTIIEADSTDDITSTGNKQETEILPPEDLITKEKNGSTMEFDSKNTGEQHQNAESSLLLFNNQNMLLKLNSRQFPPPPSDAVKKCFEIVPNFYKKSTVTVSVPDVQLIPKNVFVNKDTYTLNAETVTVKRPASVEGTYLLSDEASDPRVGRLRGPGGLHRRGPDHAGLHPAGPRPFAPGPNFYNYRPYNYFWRSQNFSNYQFSNVFVQRPFFNNVFSHQRFQYQFMRPFFNRPSFPPQPGFYVDPNLTAFNQNNQPEGPAADPRNMPRKRRRRTTDATTYYEMMRNLARRLKTMAPEVRGRYTANIDELIRSYNARFKTNVRLTEDFLIIDGNSVVETIELEDDDQSRSKRTRRDVTDPSETNLNKLISLASKLKELEMKDQSSGRHRRAFSKALKAYNVAFHADYDLDPNYRVVNRRHIVLDSSSESDCVIDKEKPAKRRKSKKLKNPFNILKKLSEKISAEMPGTSKNYPTSTVFNNEDAPTGNEATLVSNFDDKWLPTCDFGKPELVTKSSVHSRLMDVRKDQYLYSFMRDNPRNFQNWVEAKIAFLKHIENRIISMQEVQNSIMENDPCRTGLSPIIKAEDYTDVKSVLEKLRIIPTNKETAETGLAIDFDVYNRDVQNFKKRNRPKPHFRIVCFSESTPFPRGAEVAKLYSKYSDNVNVVMAVVSISAISYIQVKPTDLPVFIAGNDLCSDNV